MKKPELIVIELETLKTEQERAQAARITAVVARTRLQKLDAPKEIILLAGFLVDFIDRWKEGIEHGSTSENGSK